MQLTIEKMQGIKLQVEICYSTILFGGILKQVGWNQCYFTQLLQYIMISFLWQHQGFNYTKGEISNFYNSKSLKKWLVAATLHRQSMLHKRSASHIQAKGYYAHSMVPTKHLYVESIFY